MATQVGRSEPQNYATLLAELGLVGARMESLDEQTKATRARRDRLIRDLADRGFSEREIARAARTTGPRVHQIITKEKADA